MVGHHRVGHDGSRVAIDKGYRNSLFAKGAGGLGAGLALSKGSAAYAQTAMAAKKRVAKTTKMFKSPSGFPNGLADTPEGLWIGEQKL